MTFLPLISSSIPVSRGRSFRPITSTTSSILLLYGLRVNRNILARRLRSLIVSVLLIIQKPSKLRYMLRYRPNLLRKTIYRIEKTLLQSDKKNLPIRAIRPKQRILSSPRIGTAFQTSRTKKSVPIKLTIRRIMYQPAIFSGTSIRSIELQNLQQVQTSISSASTTFVGSTK